MRKKLLCFLLCVVLVIGLTACGSKSTNNEEKFDNSTLEKTIDGYYDALHNNHNSENAYKQNKKVMDKLAKQIMSGISEDEIKVFNNVLDKMKNNIAK